MSFTASTASWTISETTPDASTGTTTSTVSITTSTSTTSSLDAVQDAPEVRYVGTSKRHAVLVDLTRDEDCSVKLDTGSKRSGVVFYMHK